MKLTAIAIFGSLFFAGAVAQIGLAARAGVPSTSASAPASASAPSQPASQVAASEPAGRNPFGVKGAFEHEYAVPGVLEFSDGRQIAGGLYTTREKNFEVWIENEKRWRLVPFLAILCVTAVVDEEKMEQEWRWKEMGVPEKVFTGREYPTRSLSWRFHLIDDSTITGAVKGQPVWVQTPPHAGQDAQKAGPFMLSERSKGEMGQKLPDLVYIKRIVVSRKAMEQVAWASCP
jgi:hypothetical protein